MLQKINKFNNSQGFTLLLSLLIISIAATIAFSVFEIFFLQITMSSNIKDSQTAFYAADSALECVYYWGINQKKISNGNTIICNNQSIIIDSMPNETFQLLFSDIGSCATVIIDAADPLSPGVQSYGRNAYNTTLNDCDATYPRRSERALEVKI